MAIYKFIYTMKHGDFSIAMLVYWRVCLQEHNNTLAWWGPLFDAVPLNPLKYH